MRVLTRITAPMLRPALLNSGLLVFTLSVEALGIPLVLGSPQGHDFVASYLYNTWSNAITPDPPVVSAGATVLLALACALLIARRRLLGDQARFTSIGGRSAPSGSVTLKKTWRLVLALIMGLYVIATTVAPLVALALSSVVSELTPLIAPWHLLTGSHWSAIAHGQYSKSIVNTVEIAGIGAVVTTALIGLATAVAHRSSFAARATLPFTLLFPRAIPGIIIGIGFCWTFLLINPPGGSLRSSIWGLVLALSVRSLPLAYLVMSSALATVSRSLDDAARSAGASWWTAMRRIALPIVGSALFVSFILLFISTTTTRLSSSSHRATRSWA